MHWCANKQISMCKKQIMYKQQTEIFSNLRENVSTVLRNNKANARFGSNSKVITCSRFAKSECKWKFWIEDLLYSKSKVSYSYLSTVHLDKYLHLQHRHSSASEWISIFCKTMRKSSVCLLREAWTAFTLHNNSWNVRVCWKDSKLVIIWRGEPFFQTHFDAENQTM